MFCQVQLLGYLGRDPDTAFSPQGNQYTKFTVATTRKWRDASGQEQREQEWSNVIAWNGLAEACAKYLVKGRLVFISGYLRTDRWEADGVKQRRTFVVATDVRFIPTEKRPREYMPTENLPL